MEVRSSDGTLTSDVASVSFTVDQRPGVAISVHVDGKTYKDKVRIVGTATDDGAVTRVEARLDDGDWVLLDGTTEWTYRPATGKLKEGEHTLELRSFDGESYSDVLSTTFKFKKSEEPGFTLLAAMLAVLVAVPALRWRARS
jgi:hypothetical protein